MTNTREIACKILIDIQERGQKSHLALQNTWEKHPDLSGADRRFILKLVQGTLEKQIQLDHRINQKSKTPVKKMKPAIREILRMSAYQLFYMDKVPASAVCNEAVKLTVKMHFQGLKGFVNGVLRSMAREEHWPEEEIFIRYSMPQWMTKRWIREYGQEQTISMLESFSEDKKVTFRIHTDRKEEVEVIHSLQDEGVLVKLAPFPAGAYEMHGMEGLERLTAHKEGWIQIQDISSMLVGAAADCQANWKVLDVCAAPGGKSLHAAEVMKGTGLVTACDLTEYKKKLIDENIKRSQFSNIVARVQDAREFVPEWENSMDLVIADLPCSGLGVMGRKPEIRYHVTEQEISQLSQLQREILSNVWRYVKPGGYLVYSTCTIAREENQDNRQWILEHLPFEPVDLTNLLPDVLSSEEKARGEMQLIPGVHPCDGFYLAKFRRKEQ